MIGRTWLIAKLPSLSFSSIDFLNESSRAGKFPAQKFPAQLTVERIYV